MCVVVSLRGLSCFHENESEKLKKFFVFPGKKLFCLCIGLRLPVEKACL